MLIKTAGVSKVVIVINKMDESTVEWDQVIRGDKSQLTPFIKGAGFNQKRCHFIPVSAFTGANLKDASQICLRWYEVSVEPDKYQRCLLATLFQRPIVSGIFSDMLWSSENSMRPHGCPYQRNTKTWAPSSLQVESVFWKKGDTLILMPNKV